MVWPASSGPARRFRSPGGARSASLRPGLVCTRSGLRRARRRGVARRRRCCGCGRSTLRCTARRCPRSRHGDTRRPRERCGRGSASSPPPRALLRRLYRVRLTVHHRRLTRTQLRHRCRVHVFAFSFVRLRVAEQNTTGRGSTSYAPIERSSYTRARIRRCARLDSGAGIPPGLVVK